jgi:hypothetical protein
MHYEEMILELSESTLRSENNGRVGAFKVRILQSPPEELASDQVVTVEYNDRDLQTSLGKLDRRQLDTAGMIALGRTLSALLLPMDATDSSPAVRELFARSPTTIVPDKGLRLRPRLPGESV